MKKLLSIFAFAFIFFSFNAYPTDITQHMTGSWFNRDQDGHGFNIQVISEKRAVIYWYVYNPDGTPTWLVGTGEFDDVGDRIEGVLYFNTGMRWGVFDPAEREDQVRWGSITIDLVGCDNATVNYQSDDLSEKAIPYGSGTFDIERLTYVHKSKCSEVPYQGIYRGTFWSETRDEGYPGTVLINVHGDFIGFAMDHKSFFGIYPRTGDVFTSQGQVFANDTREVHNVGYTIEGQIKTDYRLFFEYSIPGIDEGFADLYPVTQLFFRDVTLADLAGDYEIEDLHVFNGGTATIGSNGVITATDDAGCNWSGEIRIEPVEFNLFDFTLTSSDCGLDNGYFTGKGFQDDAEALEDGKAIWIFSTDGQKTYSVLLTRLEP